MSDDRRARQAWRWTGAFCDSCDVSLGLSVWSVPEALEFVSCQCGYSASRQVNTYLWGLIQFNFAELRFKYAVAGEESNPQQFVSTKNLTSLQVKLAAG